jgi:hypothetical protein
MNPRLAAAKVSADLHKRKMIDGDAITTPEEVEIIKAYWTYLVFTAPAIEKNLSTPATRHLTKHINYMNIPTAPSATSSFAYVELYLWQHGELPNSTQASNI